MGLSLRKSSSISLPCTDASFYHVLMLVFAYTSIPFGFDAKLWGLIVT